MSLDDLLEPEVLVAVGVTAALMSPPVRRVLRKGAVYGLAGAMMLGDKIAAAARGVSQAARDRRGHSANNQEGTDAAAHPAAGVVPG
jgi:hypothetical protein